MKKFFLALAALIAFPCIAAAQGTVNPGGRIVIGQTPVVSCGTTGGILYNSGTTVACSPATTDSSGNLNVPAGFSFGSSADAFITRGAAATWHFGAANAASPVAQVIGAQGSRSGTDSNVGGATLRIRPGLGTGTGTRSSLILQGVDTTGSGTGAQSATDIMTISYNSGGSTTPVVQIVNPSTNSGMFILSALAPNMTNGQGAVMYFGQALTSNNYVYFNYARVGAGSTSNRLDIGEGSGNKTFISWDMNSNTYIGGASSVASPPAQTIQTVGSRAGTDTNVGGANLTIQSGTGTGTGTASTIILSAPVTVGSGSGAQTQTTVVTLSGLRATMNVPLKVKNYTVGALPTGSTGDTAYVTDHNAACALNATATAGGANVCKVWFNGTNWIIG